MNEFHAMPRFMWPCFPNAATFLTKKTWRKTDRDGIWEKIMRQWNCNIAELQHHIGKKTWRLSAWNLAFLFMQHFKREALHCAAFASELWRSSICRDSYETWHHRYKEFYPLATIEVTIKYLWNQKKNPWGGKYKKKQHKHWTLASGYNFLCVLRLKLLHKYL